jgi:glycosyltransferase involved in cell wall biosynthesis
MASKILVYGAKDRTFLSGTPFYFASALREYLALAQPDQQVINYGLKRAREIPAAFLAWSLRHLNFSIAFFLLSPKFHDENLIDAALLSDSVEAFVGFTQVLPTAVIDYKAKHPSFKVVQYLDVTLSDLMEKFDYATRAPKSVRRALIKAETASYRAADRIFVFHPDTKARMVADYGIPEAKVHAVGRGANIEPGEATAREPRAPQAGKLTLAVVGRGPQRKGVFKLIEAIDTMSPELQARIELTLYGPSPDELPVKPYLTVKGFLPASERKRLFEEMQTFDLGVLLSEADSLPGSVWEFLALGVPVWVTELPYMREELDGFPVIFEELPVNIAAVARQLEKLLSDPQSFSRLNGGWHKDPASLQWRRQAMTVANYLQTGH